MGGFEQEVCTLGKSELDDDNILMFVIKVREEITRLGGNSQLEAILAVLHVEDDQ